MEPIDLNLTGAEFARLANNFYIGQGLDSDINRINTDAQLLNYLLTHVQEAKKKYKVAVCIICVNPHYWQFAKSLIDGAKRLFLPGHDVDYFLWSDIPDDPEAFKKAEQETLERTLPLNNPSMHSQIVSEIQESFKSLQENRKNLGATIFPIEPIEWPMPTLMRYHTMLQQEEILKTYDYIFYSDVDMRFENIVGDEILGEGLTAVIQPMYALRKEFWPPYEPNEKSAAYIKRPGRIINDGGKPRFMPTYFAGGINGGKSEAFIKAMKVMKQNIDKDFNNNYTAVWNDESHWNKYFSDNLSDKDIILTPSYCYPDSLVEEYFIPMWGRDYQPKIKTLTKKFSFQPGAGAHLQNILEEIKPLK